MNPVLIGTIVWIILGLGIGYKIITYVGERSPLGKEWENQK
jgi:putative Mn2+ efflux pump MntP